MRYLGLALYAEGATDYRFLRPLLLRLCSDVCMRESRQAIEINDDVLALDHPSGLQDAPREERIVAAANQAAGAWSILFVHADADADPDRARRERTQPAIDRLRKEFGDAGHGVAVVPVRESETWAIWDGDALRQVFGTTLDDAALGLPGTSAAAERLLAPGRCLASALAVALPRGRRRRAPNVAHMLNAIGEQVSLERLRQLSAFNTLEADLRDALRAVHVLD